MITTTMMKTTMMMILGMVIMRTRMRKGRKSIPLNATLLVSRDDTKSAIPTQKSRRAIYIKPYLRDSGRDNGKATINVALNEGTERDRDRGRV
jgi:hypothetical protein